jgi:hypothetical protein
VADHKIRDLKERARRASAHQVRAVVVPSECWSQIGRAHGTTLMSPMRRRPRES